MWSDLCSIAVIAESAKAMYVGDSAGFKTFKIPVLTISDLQFAPFSDMSVGHKIFSHVRISVQSQ